MTEHDECRWAALDELETLDFTGSDRLLFPPLQDASSCTARS
jgi:hypothetical protein